MGKEIGAICAEGFAFFGKTNRLISHELKNVLAIISETLGLMEELSALPGTGMGLSPDRLHDFNASILEEVERANRITKNMNRFAHSVDTFIKEVDVSQSVSQVIELMKLDSVGKKTKFHLIDRKSCIIVTSPFFLEGLIYHVINSLVRNAGPEQKIQISSIPDDKGVVIVISAIAGIVGKFPTKRQDCLARALSAKLSLDSSAGKLNIFLPKTIGESPIQHLLSNEDVSE